jgi:hypothetical protein
MGEAKRRRDARQDAFATGALYAPVPECPACKSRDVKRIPLTEMPTALAETARCDIECCQTCRAIWEPLPVAGYIEDPVCAEPCDNCAFRPGAPEQRDSDKWREMIASLKPDSDSWFTGRFYCHKGVPIDQGKGFGNFLFPKKPVTVNGEVLLDPATGNSVMTEDISRMRVCSGFLRMFWAQAKKIDRKKMPNV